MLKKISVATLSLTAWGIQLFYNPVAIKSLLLTHQKSTDKKECGWVEGHDAVIVGCHWHCRDRSPLVQMVENLSSAQLLLVEAASHDQPRRGARVGKAGDGSEFSGLIGIFKPIPTFRIILKLIDGSSLGRRSGLMRCFREGGNEWKPKDSKFASQPWCHLKIIGASYIRKSYLRVCCG